MNSMQNCRGQQILLFIVCGGCDFFFFSCLLRAGSASSWCLQISTMWWIVAGESQIPTSQPNKLLFSRKKTKLLNGACPLLYTQLFNYGCMNPPQRWSECSQIRVFSSYLPVFVHLNPVECWCLTPTSGIMLPSDSVKAAGDTFQPNKCEHIGGLHANNVKWCVQAGEQRRTCNTAAALFSVIWVTHTLPSAALRSETPEHVTRWQSQPHTVNGHLLCLHHLLSLWFLSKVSTSAHQGICSREIRGWFIDMKSLTIKMWGAWCPNIHKRLIKVTTLLALSHHVHSDKPGKTQTNGCGGKRGGDF